VDQIMRSLDEFANAPALFDGFTGISPMCFSAFLLSRGAPQPGAPPCSDTACPDRVLAPHRGLDSIGPILRRWLLVMFFVKGE
jgi:hypothetical protein